MCRGRDSISKFEAHTTKTKALLALKSHKLISAESCVTVLNAHMQSLQYL